MNEPMREVTKGLDVTGIAEAYPKARKVTVDADNRTAYVFVGRSNRAITVTGPEFDALVEMLPPAVEGSQKAGETPAGQVEEAGETPAGQKKRGKSEKAAE